MRFWLLASILPLGLLSCGDKSAVELTVTFDQASITAQNGPLGTTLGGGFRLQFELGPEASGPTTVTPGDFSLRTASGTVLVDQLKVDTTGAGFPLVVDKGSSQTITYTVSSGKTLMPADAAAICAGQVIIVGSVMDSLKGGTDPLQSAPLTPTCS